MGTSGVIVRKHKLNEEEELGMKIADLVSVIQNANTETIECARLAEMIVKMMDTDGNGDIERDEFVNACLDVPTILDCFDQCLQPSGRIKSAVCEMREVFPEFNLGNIFSSWSSLGMKRIEFVSVSLTEFENFLRLVIETSKIKGNEQDFHTLKGLMFVHADRDAGTGNLDLRRFLIGVVSILALNLVEEDHDFLLQKAGFYFDLFDVDASDNVEYVEFFELLYSAQIELQESSFKAIEILKGLDDDGNKLVTEEEVLEALDESEVLFQCFAKIFIGGETEEDAEKRSRRVSKSFFDDQNNNNKVESKVESKEKEESQSKEEGLPLNAIYKVTYSSAVHVSPTFTNSSKTQGSLIPIRTPTSHPQISPSSHNLIPRTLPSTSQLAHLLPFSPSKHIEVRVFKLDSAQIEPITCNSVVGEDVGWFVGAKVGNFVGDFDGTKVGSIEGEFEGAGVGDIVGKGMIGDKVGTLVVSVRAAEEDGLTEI
eukprot:snap_masked-scaffold_54-processed-gene-0.8-mRNA-1 protein AED:1.00 eAED:1.00 QI:0/0/0/0/1/1/3/0/483